MGHGRQEGGRLEFLSAEKGEVAVADLQEDLPVAADLDDAEVVELPFPVLAQEVEDEEVVRDGRAGFVAEIRLAEVGRGGRVTGRENAEGDQSAQEGAATGSSKSA